MYSFAGLLASLPTPTFFYHLGLSAGIEGFRERIEPRECQEDQAQATARGGKVCMLHTDHRFGGWRGPRSQIFRGLGGPITDLGGPEFGSEGHKAFCRV